MSSRYWYHQVFNQVLQAQWYQYHSFYVSCTSRMVLQVCLRLPVCASQKFVNTVAVETEHTSMVNIHCDISNTNNLAFYVFSLCMITVSVWYWY